MGATGILTLRAAAIFGQFAVILEGNIMRFVRRHFVQQVGAAAGASRAIIYALVCMGFGLIAPAWGAAPNVVGNWKVVSLVYEELATGNKTNPLGEHPKGYLIYTPEGRMMSLLVHEKARAPKTDEDRIDLHKYMIAYSGRYTVEGEKVVHHVDVSWNESFTGDQVRFVKLEGDMLKARRRHAHDQDCSKQECNYWTGGCYCVGRCSRTLGIGSFGSFSAIVRRPH